MNDATGGSGDFRQRCSVCGELWAPTETHYCPGYLHRNFVSQQVGWGKQEVTFGDIRNAPCVEGAPGVAEPPRQSILTEAATIVDGDREETYGHPAKNFEQTAKLWAPILGHPVSLQQVALMMVMLKVARQLHKPKRDHLVDICGYTRCIEKMQDAGADLIAEVQ